MEALNAIAANMQDLQLKVGIFEGATYPDGQKVAPIAVTQEYGALIYHKAREQTINFKVTKSGKSRFSKKAKANFQQTVNIEAHATWIPPRPFFRNAIQSNEQSWKEYIDGQAAKGVPAKTILDSLGERIVGDVVQSISTLTDPPLKKATLRSRRSRGNSSDKPLVDTKTLIRSVSHEVGSIQGDNE